MLTIIYYTSNTEDEAFEQKIRDSLLGVIGDLPLISVSQKPIDFGHNICVGDIGVCDGNVFKQVLIGCQAAKTPLVAMAEADCLYPPTGYFDFRPDNMDTAYFSSNLWILWKTKTTYSQKTRSLCALVSGRDYLIRVLKKRLKRWSGTGKIFGLFWKHYGWEHFDGALPVVSIKTGNGMRWNTGTIKGGLPVSDLPHWGSAKMLRDELFSWR